MKSGQFRGPPPPRVAVPPVRRRGAGHGGGAGPEPHRRREKREGGRRGTNRRQGRRRPPAPAAAAVRGNDPQPGRNCFSHDEFDRPSRPTRKLSAGRPLRRRPARSGNYVPRSGSMTGTSGSAVPGPAGKTPLPGLSGRPRARCPAGSEIARGTGHTGCWTLPDQSTAWRTRMADTAATGRPTIPANGPSCEGIGRRAGHRHSDTEARIWEARSVRPAESTPRSLRRRGLPLAIPAASGLPGQKAARAFPACRPPPPNALFAEMLRGPRGELLAVRSPLERGADGQRAAGYLVGPASRARGWHAGGTAAAGPTSRSWSARAWSPTPPSRAVPLRWALPIGQSPCLGHAPAGGPGRAGGTGPDGAGAWAPGPAWGGSRRRGRGRGMLRELRLPTVDRDEVVCVFTYARRGSARARRRRRLQRGAGWPRDGLGSPLRSTSCSSTAATPAAQGRRREPGPPAAGPGRHRGGAPAPVGRAHHVHPDRAAPGPAPAGRRPWPPTEERERIRR